MSTVIRPNWLVTASVCDCNKVALTIMHKDVIDPHASMTVDGDHEIMAAGDDWRTLYQPVALQMAERTGLMISACCTSVFTREGDSAEMLISEEISRWVYAERPKNGEIKNG